MRRQAFASLSTCMAKTSDLRFSVDRVGLEENRGTGTAMEAIGFGPDEYHEITPSKGAVPTRSH